jgi:hypothetical protein
VSFIFFRKDKQGGFQIEQQPSPDYQYHSAYYKFLSKYTWINGDVSIADIIPAFVYFHLCYTIFGESPENF